MTAQEIGAAWLEYVTETFMLKEDGCVRPDVGEEYRSLESDDEFSKHRELWRDYTDNLIDKILQCPSETREELLDATDRRSLAYVQDRVQCGTELLTALIQKGLQINVEGAESIPDFFRQILIQRQA
jgi:hypothetical protein